MLPLTSFYVICFSAGVFWALFVGVLPNVMRRRSDSVSPDAAGTPDEHGSLSTSGEAAVLSPWSSVVIATFLTAFGAGGSVVQRLLHMPLHVHLPAAFACGLAIATLTYRTLKLATGSR
ncbi:MAG: hypothetical protein AB1714_22640 [Acidobacteriota bacterium]